MQNKPLLRTSVPSTKSSHMSPAPHANSGVADAPLQDGTSQKAKYGNPPSSLKSTGAEPRQTSLERESPEGTKGGSKDGRRLFQMCTLDGRELFTIERW